MLVGLGGNNGTTITGGILANKQYVHPPAPCPVTLLFYAIINPSSVLVCSGMTWQTKEGRKKPNYFGSITQAATCRIGNFKGEEVHAPFNGVLPMVNPEDLVIGGWDISGLNMADAMGRAQVHHLPMPRSSWAYHTFRYTMLSLIGLDPVGRMAPTATTGWLRVVATDLDNERLGPVGVLQALPLQHMVGTVYDCTHVPRKGTGCTSGIYCDVS